jgi:hypothetical protein
MLFQKRKPSSLWFVGVSTAAMTAVVVLTSSPFAARVNAWTISPSSTRPCFRSHQSQLQRPRLVLFSTPPPTDQPVSTLDEDPWAEDDDEDDASVVTTSFADAGRSLMEEEDQTRMEQMGDFDENPNVS